MKNKMLWMLAGVTMLRWARTLVAGAVLLLLAREAPGALPVPLALNYQGRLQLGQNGFTPGAYGLQFQLWNAPSGGTLLWARSISSVYVSSNGVFSATLKNDAGAELPPPLPLTSDLLTAFSGGSVYLGITVVQTPSGPVASPSQISPSRQFLSAPYSLTAHFSDDAHTLLNGTNLLSQSGIWPPSPVYAIGWDSTSLSSATPLTPLLEIRPGGLWTSLPLTFNNVLQVANLNAANLNASSPIGLNTAFTFGGSVKMLQPPGQPSGSLDLSSAQGAANPANQYQAPQDGLFAITYPATDLAYDAYNWWYYCEAMDTAVTDGTDDLAWLSVIQFAPRGQPFPSQHVRVMPGSVCVQTVRFFPVPAGQSISLLIRNSWFFNTPPSTITYQFLPFGGPP